MLIRGPTSFRILISSLQSFNFQPEKLGYKEMGRFCLGRFDCPWNSSMRHPNMYCCWTQKLIAMSVGPNTNFSE